MGRVLIIKSNKEDESNKERESLPVLWPAYITKDVWAELISA